MKIRTRKEREKEYESLYGDISNDKFQRLKNELGDKFNEELLLDALSRVEEVQSKIKYHMIHFTFYEEPIQSHRPRMHGKFKGMYVPNAKANSEAIGKFVKNLKDDISIVATPMKII